MDGNIFKSFENTIVRDLTKKEKKKKKREKNNHTYFLSVFLCVCVSIVSLSHGIGIGDEEIQRQNRITAQIVANYLERRLFPFKRPSHRLPTVDEILPTTSQQLNQHDNTAESKTKITRQLEHGTNGAPTNDDDIGDEDYSDDINEHDIDPNDPENLQTVESNHVDSYYPEMNESISNDHEGRFHTHFHNFFFFFSLVCIRLFDHPNIRISEQQCKQSVSDRATIHIYTIQLVRRYILFWIWHLH